MNLPGTIDERHAAAAMGMTVDFFRRQRPALEESGFPPPIFPDPDRPGARNRRWSANAVQNWIDRQVKPDANSAAPASDSAREQRRALLQQRIPTAAGRLAG